MSCISSCVKCWRLDVFVAQGCCQEREGEKCMGGVLGSCPARLHWCDPCRQGELGRGISPLWVEGNWFGFVLFQNESLVVGWIKSTLYFTSSIPESAGTRQMGGKWEYRELFLNRSWRAAVNKCRLFWRVWFCAPEASSHPRLSLPGCKLRAQSCFSRGSSSSLPPGVAAWGCAWRALCLLTFSSALGFVPLFTMEETLVCLTQSAQKHAHLFFPAWDCSHLWVLLNKWDIVH